MNFFSFFLLICVLSNEITAQQMNWSIHVKTIVILLENVLVAAFYQRHPPPHPSPLPRPISIVTHSVLPDEA